MPRKIKSLAFINQTLGFGGAEIFQRDLFSWFNKKGVDITVYSTSERFLKQVSFANITRKIPIVIDIIGDWKGFIKGIVLFPIALFYYGYFVWSIRGVDLVIVGGYIEKVLTSPWAKLFGIRVAWIEYGPLSEILSKFNSIPKHLYKLVKTTPDVVIVPSSNTKKDLVNNMGVNKNVIKIIPCAVNVPKINKSVIVNRVCCVSRLQEGKGQDLLIKAWPKVVKKIPDAKLFIVGEGEKYRKVLQDLVKNLGLNRSVIFTGWVKSSVDEIAKSEISVFPSIWELEGFGLVTIESMALGKGVVAFDVGPTPELVENRKTGLLVSSGDVNKLAEAIVLLLKNKGVAKRYGKAGRKRYLKHYTFETVGSEYLNVLNKHAE